jgi:hypothetical protein
MKTLALGLAAILVASAAPAAAAVISSLPGGQAQAMPAVDDQGTGPHTFGAITWSSNGVQSLFGWTDTYGFLDNGEWVGTPMAGTNGTEPVMSFTFSSPIAAFLAEVNWPELPEEDAFVRAYGAGGVLLEELQVLDYGENAVTPGYMGFRRTSAEITRIEFAGGYLGARNIAILAEPGAIPEPATWGLLIAGFGLAGGALRRRRLAVSAAA